MKMANLMLGQCFCMTDSKPCHFNIVFIKFHLVCLSACMLYLRIISNTFQYEIRMLKGQFSIELRVMRLYWLQRIIRNVAFHTTSQQATTIYMHSVRDDQLCLGVEWAIEAFIYARMVISGHLIKRPGQLMSNGPRSLGLRPCALHRVVDTEASQLILSY